MPMIDYKKERAGLYSFRGGFIERFVRQWYAFLEQKDSKKVLGPYKTLWAAGYGVSAETVRR